MKEVDRQENSPDEELLKGLFAGDSESEKEPEKIERKKIGRLSLILSQYIADKKVCEVIESVCRNSRIWELSLLFESYCRSEAMISLQERVEVLRGLGGQITEEPSYHVRIPSKMNALYQDVRKSTKDLIDRVKPELKEASGGIENPLADALGRLAKFANPDEIFRSKVVGVSCLQENDKTSFIFDSSRKNGPFSFNAILLATPFYYEGEKEDSKAELDFEVQVYPYFKEGQLYPVNSLFVRILKDSECKFFTVVLVAETVEANQRYDEVLGVLVGNSETGEAISLTSFIPEGSIFLLSGSKFEAGGVLDPFHKIPRNFLGDYRRMIPDLEGLLTIAVLHKLKLIILAEEGLNNYLKKVDHIRVSSGIKEQASSKLREILEDLSRRSERLD